MKKLLIMLLLLAVTSADAQVQFSKFKFAKDSPFGCCPGRRMTDMKFTVTAQKPLKTVAVQYVGVDEVGDAVCSDIVGAVNANVKHTKYNLVRNTGPFRPGQQYSRWSSGTFWYPTKVTAFPLKIIVDYMDKSIPSDTININKDNLRKFFPKMQWMDVDLEAGFQPSN